MKIPRDTRQRCPCPFRSFACRFLIVLIFTILFIPAERSVALAVPCTPDEKANEIPIVSLTEVVRGLQAPVHITHAGDGSERLYVVEQPGVIRVLEHGNLLENPFLDIRGRVDWGGEKGLLSVAFHPKYRDNGYFYVDYTARHKTRLYTILSRFKSLNAVKADIRSEQVLLEIEQPYSNHNGGQLAFGPDGYLYIGMGDGGSANDPHGNGQDLKSLLGKVLRIDVDKKPGSLPGPHSRPLGDSSTKSAGVRPPYTIPRDNPFVGKPKFRPEVWAYGLRNPWRFSFDVVTGRLYLADVGQNEVEEVDVIEKGGNYGWNIMEGTICTPGVNAACNTSGLLTPIFTYRHPEGFSITGGFVYRGHEIPGLCGVYLYADYVTGRLWGLYYDGRSVVTYQDILARPKEDTPPGQEMGPIKQLSERLKQAIHGDPDLHISSFGQDESLELYVTDHQAGRVLKIIPKVP